MQQQNHHTDLKPGSQDEFIVPSWPLMELAKYLEVNLKVDDDKMDPWIINDMINREDMKSSCSSLSDRVETLSSSNSDTAAVASKSNINTILVPQDKVIQLINALSADPNAFMKPQRKV